MGVSKNRGMVTPKLDGENNGSKTLLKRMIWGENHPYGRSWAPSWYSGANGPETLCWDNMVGLVRELQQKRGEQKQLWQVVGEESGIC